MPRERSGSFFKREKKLENGKTVITWWARLTYVDHVNGKRRDRQRRAENRAHAKELVQKLISEYDATGGRSLEHGRKTFAELAEHYEANYLKPAVYVEGRKVAGVRSLTPAKAAVSALKAYFGVRPLRGITYGDILEYRAAMLRMPTRGDIARHEREQKEDPQAKIRVTRTIATVNRELEKQRHMMNIAQREGWILRNPMQGTLWNASPRDAIELWKSIRLEARDEFISGHYGARPFETREYEHSAWKRAQYLAVRDSLIEEWRPRGASEYILIDQMTHAYVMQLHWAEEAMSRAQLEPRVESYEFREWVRCRKAEAKAQQWDAGQWDIPYQHQAEAIEQAFRLVDLCAKSFQRAARQLANIRLVRAKTARMRRRDRVKTLKPVNKVA